MATQVYRALRRYLNSLPLPLTVKQYYPFDSAGAEFRGIQLRTPESWDALRRAHPNFVLPYDRVTWLRSMEDSKDGQDPALIARAREIAELASRRRITHIYSVGAGGSALEYYLKQSLPSTRLTVSDYSLTNVDRLRRVFTECDEITLFDMTQADWNRMGGGGFPGALVLMYRVDTNFSNQQWRRIFQNMSGSRVSNILYVPANIMTVRSYANLRARNRRARLAGHTPSFAGYIRTATAYSTLWKGLYTSEPISLSQMPSFWLSLIDGE